MRARRHWSEQGVRAWRLRWRLQRRIFAWFGATILLSSLVTGAVVALTGSSGWKQSWTGMQSFAAKRYALVWDDARARDELARSMHDDLHVGVLVKDARGDLLSASGACEGAKVDIPIDKGGERVGLVTVCSERHRGGFGRLWVGLVVSLVVLWAAAHAIARRLTRPLVEIERVARAIGKGDLSSRVDLSHARGEEVMLLGSTLNEMADRIERQIAEYKSLLATVSHEIRTPLARMRLLAELAGAKEERVAELDREIVQLDALVGELLALSRVDFGAVTTRRVSAADAALRALEDARVDPSVLSLEDAKLEVDADPTLLERALRNLLENAVRHGGGVARFTVRAEAHEVAFEVEDDGPGIPEGEEDRIFEPFRKISNDAASVGLGLALVKRVAIAHGGRAYAKNRSPRGALVGFTLRA